MSKLPPKFSRTIVAGTIKSGREQEPLPIPAQTDSSFQMYIDKLYFVISCSWNEAEEALDRAKLLIKKNSLSRGSHKGTRFKHAFVLKLKSRSVVRFHFIPTDSDAVYPVQIVMNPNHMREGDCDLIKEVFKFIFMQNALDFAAAMLIRRTDVCTVLPYPIDDLLIMLAGTRVGALFYIRTSQGGYQQTVYAGGENSAHHGVIYDQVASDEYKVKVGELPSRVKTRDAADITIETKPGRTQLESRRNFKKPVTLAELAAVSQPFEDYKILQLTVDRKKYHPLFCGYLDSVRIRGVHGTRKFWTERCGNAAEVSAELDRLEQQLMKMAAPWWKPEQYRASLLTTLKASAAWPFIKIMSKGAVPL